jgi:predicted Zn-ribbon and HTH transcriptional regulator
MFRKDLIQLLLDNPMSVSKIAREVGDSGSRVADDLQHVIQTLRNSDRELVVTPARCRKCGFEFSSEKLTKPSKCPKCRGGWIKDPLVEIRQRPN